MFDRGDLAIGNVWIALDLRRRRNGNGNRNYDARHRGDAGRRNIEFDGNLGDVRRVDILRNDGNVGIDRNVWLRFEQHCCIVESNVNVIHHDERRRSRRSSVGFHWDRQSRGECRTSGTNAKRIAHYRQRGVAFVGTNNAHGFTDGKHYPVNNHFVCERERS